MAKKFKKKVPESPNCGVEAEAGDRIILAREAEFREFSWMVLLQFLKRNMRVNFIFQRFDVIWYFQLGIRRDFIVAAV